MVNEVFANGLEIACKSAEGVSAAAFPDPCWSPPPPKAGPVLVPYANTAYAKDLANASRTVFITQKPVALKDYSFFKTSTGNEPATWAFGQGKKTGVITGKAYFRSWSMDVFVEGYNVCRHQDKMTHNHGSDPGNTGNWTYVDTKAAKKACEDDIERVEDECGVDKEENQRFRKKQQKRADREADKAKKNKKPAPKPPKIRNKTWKDKNCLGLMIKPTNIKKIEEKLGQFQEEAIEVMSDIDQVIVDMAIDKGKAYAVRAGAKHVAALGCTALTFGGTVACEFGVAVYNVGDAAYSTISAGLDVWELKDEIGQLRDQLNHYQKTIGRLEDFGKGAISKDQFWGEFRDQMKEVVRENDCLKARKCMLTPFNKAQTANKHGKDKHSNVKNNQAQGTVKGADDLFGKMGNASTGGCCPGQTGHHLIPEAWMKNCPSYDQKKHNAAPVVCAEGTGHSDGTHGTLHTQTDAVTKAHLGQSLSMDDAISKAIDAHEASMHQDFGGPGLFDWDGEHCARECLEAQLKAFYQSFNCKPVPTDKQGNTGPSVPTTER